MTNYEKGRQLEKKVLDYFRRHGFVGCRAAQSRGPYDVILSPPIGLRKNLELSLNIQIGPKSKMELRQLKKIACTHHGLAAHAYIYKKEKEPRINVFFVVADGYRKFPEFLMAHYGFKIYEVESWKYAINMQALVDREARKAKKR